MSIKQLPEILKKIQEIHERKNKDYAQADDPFSNFKRASIIASWFDDPIDKVFATLTGIKLARLAELLNGKTPLHESIDDSFLDKNTYGVIWQAWNLAKNEDGTKKEDLLQSSNIPYK